MNTRCDKCNFAFEIIPNKDFVYSQDRGRIDRTFFKCPCCGKEYDIGYTCDAVRTLLQLDRRKTAERLEKKLRAEFRRIKKEQNNGRRKQRG